MKIFVGTVVSGGQYVYTFTNKSKEGMLNDVAEYCTSNWSNHEHLEDLEIPVNVDDIIEMYFDNNMDEEDDWWESSESTLHP